MTRARFLALFAASVTALGLYLVDRPGQLPPLVCGLKPALPAAVRTGMGLADPVQEDGTTPATQTGVTWTSTACLPPDQAAAYLSAVDLLGEIGASGAWDVLTTSSQCRGVRVVTESEQADGGDMQRRPREALVQLRGPTPPAGILARMATVSGRSIAVAEVGPVYACASQPAVRVDRPPYSAAALARLPGGACACCQRGGGTCTETLPDGGTAAGQPARQYPAASLSGAGKCVIPCGSSQAVVDLEGKDYPIAEHCPACF